MAGACDSGCFQPSMMRACLNTPTEHARDRQKGEDAKAESVHEVADTTNKFTDGYRVWNGSACRGSNQKAQQFISSLNG